MLRIILKKSALVLLLIVLLLPIFLLPLSFLQNPDIKIYHDPSGFTLSDVEKYSESCTFAAKYKSGIYAVSAGFLDTVGFDIIIGRDFDSGIISRGDCVIAVSKTYAIKEFLNTDVLGCSIDIGSVRYRIGAVFDDKTTSFENIAGIDFSGTMFIPYTSVANCGELKMNAVVSAGDIPEELSLRLMKAENTDMSYYKEQIRVTQTFVILALTGIITVVNLVHFRKSKLKWVLTVIIFIILILMIFALWHLPSEAIPAKGNVIDLDFHKEAFNETVASLIDGDMRTLPRLFYLNKIALTIYIAVIFLGTLWINRRLTN